MGYSTRISGELEVTPPVADGQFELGSNELRYFLKWELSRPVAAKVTLEDGAEFTSTVALSTRLVARGQQGKAYDFEVELRQLLKKLSDSGRIVSGEIVGVGESPEDIWRLRVDTARVPAYWVKETAEIRWPDGTPVTGIEL